jgi:hypothetical protein
MEQMIFCAMAMVVLRWWTSVAPWRMVKDREYHLVTNEGPPYVGAWSSDWQGPKQEGPA